MKKNKASVKKVIMKSKLKHYSALAASVVALDASAQVVYTNINDTTLVNNGDYFDIDLNNDGIREGRIEFIDISSTFYSSSFILKAAEVDSLVNASVNVINSVFGTTTTSTSSTYVAAPLNLNANISNSLNNWSSGPATTTYSSSLFNGVLIGGKAVINSSSTTSTTSVGQFPGVGDRFLGVKFTIGTSTHYGWLRLDMSANSDSLTIKDFAYQATPNTAILAGDTGTAVGLSKRNLKDKLDYFAANGRIKINSELTSNSTLSIFDLSGKLLQSELISTQKEISIQGNLQGIYIVEIRNSTGVTRKKLWLESN
ncbi:MAG: hypothetical protein ACJAV5_001469 [Vicingaceae bacterium]|jgi:hypothetical protein